MSSSEVRGELPPPPRLVRFRAMTPFDVAGVGVGRQMLMLLIERASQAGMQDVFLEVRPSNLHAIALYQSVGFAEVGRRRDYYQAAEGREDALVLKLSLPVKSGG